jgi:hypothetical protein
LFHDLDSTLASLLTRELSRTVSDKVTISFATPDGQFPPASISLPAVNLFLYDLQENSDLRDRAPLVARKTNGSVSSTPAPLRVDCYYLVTAWAPAGADSHQREHQLLGDAMKALIRYREIPPQVLQGSMQQQPYPLRAVVLKAGPMQGRGEFWQALGGKPRAAFNYAVTIGVDMGEPQIIGRVADSLRI